MTPDREREAARICEAALDRSTLEREVFIVEECAGDEALRREVESLLRQQSKADGFLQRPALEVAAMHALAPHTLVVGQQVGSYQIQRLLGAGGMGEVYRAHDTKLGRDVAIKILPRIFASDPNRLARFEREAHLLAALNHPNIGAIYGLEVVDGEPALVLELVDGHTLADRLKKGPLHIPDALKIASQIADALEAAHERGIVHRDLKPANIVLRDSIVKVLDFGLARAVAGDGTGHDLVPSPAITEGGGLEGVVLGTAAYMSPEQARGQVVDKRTDIWAFGCVLYELLTARAAFLGATTADTMASIIHRDPDWGVLPAGTPAGLRRLLRRCLDKDPRQRLRDIGEARIQLEQIVDELDAPTLRQAPPTARLAPWLVSVWVAVGVLAAALLIASSVVWRVGKPADRPLVRLDVDLGADVSLPPSSIPGMLAISPEGTRLVFGSGSGLFTRRLDQSKATTLPGTEGGILPFFSPDGEWVGFYAHGKLNKISVDGGAVVPLADIANFAGASWGEDGGIVASVPLTRGLLRIPADGGAPETVAELGNGQAAFVRPQVLPGGKAILFSSRTILNREDTIEILTLADRHRKIVARGGVTPRYMATSSGSGHLVYSNKATLFAIPFDLDKLETRGTAVAVLDDVQNGQFDVSRSGTLVYRRASGGAPALMTVQWVDPNGKKEPLQAGPGAYRALRLSPDGKRVVLTVAEATVGQDVWVYDPQRDRMTRLTYGQIVTSPTWSPDARYVVFYSVNNGIFQARADGASHQQVLTVGHLIPSSFSTDGKRLAYFDGKADRFQIGTLPVMDHAGQLEAGLPEQFMKSDFSDMSPSFSPDGQWLAYQSNESGRSEVYVRAFPAPSSGEGLKWLISNNGGVMPHWSRSGHALVYQSDDQLLTVSYTVKGGTFDAEKPRVWIHQLGGTVWDLAPDGKRVAVLTPVTTGEATKPEHEVVFLQNFFDELRRRVPVGRQSTDR
jgi:serine/threonine-protein kinase